MCVVRVLVLLLFSSFLLSCSTHPLQDRVTGLSISQLDEKVRCEAAQTVAAISKKKGFEGIRQAYKLALEDLQRDRKAVNTHLNKRAGLTFERKSYDEREINLANRKKELDARLNRIITTRNDETLDDVKEQLATYYADTAEHHSEKQTFNMKVAKFNAKTKRLQDQYDLANKQFNATYKGINDFVMSGFTYRFRFKITEENDGSSDGKVTIPTNIGSVVIGWEAGDTKEREAERSVKLTSMFGSLLEHAETCQTQTQARFNLPGHYPIKGQIGLEEVIAQYVEIEDKDNVAFEGGTNAYQDTLKFTTTLSGGLKPTITLSQPFVTVSGDVGAKAKRVDLHELIILLAPPKPAGSTPVQNIRIVSDGILE